MSQTSGQNRGTLPATSFGTALALVAFTMPLGLMGSIVPDLAAGPSGRTWILSSMSVGLAATLLVAGSLADDLGRKRMFLLGLVTFAIGSVVAAAAQSVAMLSAGRAIEGIGAAALLATALSLIAHEYPLGPGRAHATGVWGSMLGAGIAIGPIFGALIAELGSWHTAYAVLSVVAVASIYPVSLALRESTAADPKPVDVIGTALLAAGLVAFTVGVVQGNTSGWGSPTVVGSLLLGVVLLASFAAFEHRTTYPLFDITLLGRPAFDAALLGSFALGFTVLSFMSYAMTFTQTTLGAGAVAATLWGLPWALVSFVVAYRARWIGQYLSARSQVSLGLLICAIALLTMLGLDAGSSPAHLVPGFIVLGVGTGLLNASLAQAAVSVVPPSRSGMGAGANNTARYLGAALGVALVVGLLHSGTEQRAMDSLSQIATPPIAAPLSSAIANGGPSIVIAATPSAARPEMASIAVGASTGAMNTVILVLAALAALSALACYLLMAPPHKTEASRERAREPAPSPAPTPTPTKTKATTA
jgi:MFS family permease